MPQRPRRKREKTAASQRSAENQTVTVPTTSQEPPQSQRAEPKSHLHILLVFPILLLIASNSLVTSLYVRALDPLYGSIPVHLHLDKVVWVATIAGAFGPVPSVWHSLAILGSLVASIPASSYWAAVYTGRIGNAAVGPLAVHLVVLCPMIYFGVSLVKRTTAAFETSTSNNTTARFTILPACATSVIGLQSAWSGVLESYRFGFSDSDILRIIGVIYIALYAIHLTPTSVMPSQWGQDRNLDGSLPPRSLSSYFLRLFILVLPALLWLLNPPLLPQPMIGPYTHPNFPLRILSSVPSVTGMIVVGEILPSDTWVPNAPEPYPSSFRYLRASHSLLGGVWIGKQISTRARAAPLLDAEGTLLGDSIYSAFVLQEAVRLIDTTDRAVQSGQEKALFIGLGAGVAVTSFAKQNIDTTVIEIDPAVYNASRQYFGLPDLGHSRVFLEDARVVVAEKARAALQYGVSNPDKYDYVVHDCFSGGGVPAHLFTLQFWEDLKIIMNPEGVVAVNFAGRISSDPAKAVLFTLQRSFGQCRVLHDLPTSQPEADEFVNLVFFCSPSTKPLSFRSPTEKDYAGSHLRARMFDSLGDREVDMKLIRGDSKDEGKWVLDDTNNRLMDWQKAEALEHWNLMQRIFPEPLWTTY